MKYNTGRLVVQDTRDQDYPALFCATTRHTRYWNQNGWKGNQGQTPHCVAYAWLHYLEDGPITHKLVSPPLLDPLLVYNKAQKADRFPGEDYNGTTVRAGAKVLQSMGYIKEYRWATTLPGLVNAVLEMGPVVVGTYWFNSMYAPKRGRVTVEGTATSGHAYLINGVNVTHEKFRFKNSWGSEWGISGSAYISFEDMEKLLKWGGEACVAVEVTDKQLKGD